MKISIMAVNIAALLLQSTALVILGDAVGIMIPWMMAITAVVVTDLVVGVRKSLHLGVHVSISLAFRETMGKLIVYNTIVLGVAMVDTVAGHELSIAKWGCLFVCLLEGTSIVSNLLKPYGIDLSLRTILKMFAKKKLDISDEDAEKLMNEGGNSDMIEREKSRWERRENFKYGAHENPSPDDTDISNV